MVLFSRKTKQGALCALAAAAVCLKSGSTGIIGTSAARLPVGEQTGNPLIPLVGDGSGGIIDVLTTVTQDQGMFRGFLETLAPPYVKGHLDVYLKVGGLPSVEDLFEVVQVVASVAPWHFGAYQVV